MARTVFIAGNDGSGKSTYARRLGQRLEGRGWRVRRVAYYDSFVRRSFRGAVELMTGASRKKLAPSAASPAPDAVWAPARGGKRWAMLAFLTCYQIAMALEWRLRDLLAVGNLLLCERSFLDDLASIAEVLRVQAPDWLIRGSGRLFPVCRLCYLSAGHEREYSRIVTMDLSPRLHQRKGQRYEQWVLLLRQAKLPVRRINTGRHTQATRPAAEKPI